MVRHILNLAAAEWLDEYNLTWLSSAPKIKLLAVTDARKPYPLSWDEQTRLLQALLAHLAGMALFKVNTQVCIHVSRQPGDTDHELGLETGLEHVRVHDLKHTFGRRLRAAGVSLEDRQDLLRHRSGRITTHYSQAELLNLIEAANRVCGQDTRKSPALVMLKQKAR